MNGNTEYSIEISYDYVCVPIISFKRNKLRTQISYFKFTEKSNTEREYGMDSRNFEHIIILKGCDTHMCDLYLSNPHIHNKFAFDQFCVVSFNIGVN